jgi:hypothetical protein
MRRLARILLNAATVLSAVLCVALVGLWISSPWYVVRANYVMHDDATTATTSFHLSSGFGMLSAGYGRGAIARPVFPTGWSSAVAYIAQPYTWAEFKGSLVPHRFSIGPAGYGTKWPMVSFWPLVLLTAPLPVVRAVCRYRRRRRVQPQGFEVDVPSDTPEANRRGTSVQG